jgi:hypothetical protein
MTKPQPIPEGYGTVTPWVVTKDTRRLLQFIKEAFDAEELGRVEVEGGAIGHAEARIGDRWISTDRISIVGDLLDGRGDCRRETADLLPPFCLDGRTCHD